MDQINVKQVIKTVTAVMKIKEKDIVGKGRSMDIALARQISMYLSKK